MVAMTAVSCVRGTFFSLKNSVVIKDYPIDFDVADPDTLALDAMGIQGIKVLDDKILLSSSSPEGCLSLFAKDGTRLSKPFLRIGRGPGECLFQPFVSWIVFDDSSGKLSAGLFDYKGNYLEYDLTQEPDSSCVWTCIAESLPTSSGARYFKVGDFGLLCREGNKEETGFIRFLKRQSGEEFCNEAMMHLNSLSSSQKNLLSTIVVVNSEKGIIAELGGRMNVVHIYSLAGSFQKTLMTDGQRQDISFLSKLSPEDSPKSYYDAHSYKDGFAGLYLGTTIKELDNGSFPPPVIHLFKWDGTPVAQIRIPVKALFFDIDFRERKLYVVEFESENILVFDLPDF